jgi:hypothetical protein
MPVEVCKVVPAYYGIDKAIITHRLQTGSTLYKLEDVSNGVLPIKLALQDFSLPIKEHGGHRFAWLDPSSDVALQTACATETGILLMELIDSHNKQGAVAMLPPSGKSTVMAEQAVKIAASLAGNTCHICTLGGGTMDDF